MVWAVGSPITESFEVGSTGQTFTRIASYIDGVSAVWNPTFSELGNGFYRYTYTPEAVGAWEWVGTSTDGTRVTINVQVITADQAMIAVSLAGADVTYVAPLSADGGTVRLIQGDSYAAAQSRQLIWNLTGQPDLTGATTTLTIIVKHVTVTSTATVTNPAGGSPTITATLTTDDTDALPAAVGVFDLSATIGSDELTLVRGRVYVEADV